MKCSRGLQRWAVWGVSKQNAVYTCIIAPRHRCSRSVSASSGIQQKLNARKVKQENFFTRHLFTPVLPTLFSNTSLQHSSTAHSSNALLQHLSTTLFSNASRHKSTTTKTQPQPTQKTPPQRHHKNTTTPPTKCKNTTTPPQKHNHKKTKNTITKTQPRHHKNPTTKTQKTPPHHHKNTTTKHHHTTTKTQYYSVLQSTTPVLLCTTKCYKVPLQYYFVLQNATPVLLSTNKWPALLRFSPVKNAHFTTALGARHARSDERVARWRQKCPFYHSFERPTHTK